MGSLYWFLTHLSHHLDTLRIPRARTDPCALIKRNKGILNGHILLKVDESLGLNTEPFLEERQVTSKSFRWKPRTAITKKPTSFNRINISTSNGNNCIINQTDKMTGYNTMKIKTNQQPVCRSPICRGKYQTLYMCSNPTYRTRQQAYFTNRVKIT